MDGNKSKRPRVSYEEGELRNKSIAKMQDRKYGLGTCAVCEALG